MVVYLGPHWGRDASHLLVLSLRCVSSPFSAYRPRENVHFKINFMCICKYMCRSTYGCVYRSKRRVLDPSDVELQMSVSCLTCYVYAGNLNLVHSYTASVLTAESSLSLAPITGF